MSTTGADMLRLLGSGVRPFDQSAPKPAPASAGPDFARMLGQARQGELRTGLDVAVSAALDLTLSPEQRTALSEAADKAEASGSQQSLIMLDTMSLILDVASREIVDVADMAQVGVLTGIDSVIRASTEPQAIEQDESGDDPAPEVGGNISLLDALSRIDQRRTGAA